MNMGQLVGGVPRRRGRRGRDMLAKRWRTALQSTTLFPGWSMQGASDPITQFIRLYIRVIGLLRPEARLAWLLCFANIGVAVAQFAEPVLFGRIVDALAGTPTGQGTAWSSLIPLLVAWIVFAIITIVCGVLLAVNAERISHRRRHAALTDYFEHVLQLPMRYHGETHSGR